MHQLSNDPFAAMVRKFRSECTRRNYLQSNPVLYMLDRYQFFIVAPVMMEMYRIWEATMFSEGSSTISMGNALSLLNDIKDGDGGGVTRELRETLERTICEFTREHHNKEAMGDAHLVIEALHNSSAVLGSILRLDMASATLADDLSAIINSKAVTRSLTSFEKYKSHKRSQWSTMKLDRMHNTIAEEEAAAAAAAATPPPQKMQMTKSSDV